MQRIPKTNRKANLFVKSKYHYLNIPLNINNLSNSLVETDVLFNRKYNFNLVNNKDWCLSNKQIKYLMMSLHQINYHLVQQLLEILLHLQ
jgi:hypothetical protein